MKKEIVFLWYIPIREYSGTERYIKGISERLSKKYKVAYINIEQLYNTIKKEKGDRILEYFYKKCNSKLNRYKIIYNIKNNIKLPIFLIKKRNTFLYLGNLSLIFSLVSSIPLIKLKKHILILGNHIFFIELFLFKLDKEVKYPFGTRFGLFILKLFLKTRLLTQDQVKIHALNPIQYRIYKYLGFKNVYLIPNFLETVKIKNIKENLDEFIVCYIGRIDPKHKGIDILIEVMKKTLEKNKDIKFYIGGTGDNEFEKQLKELENNYPNNVKYLGRISDEEKFELLSKSSIFILPSRWEGMPLAILEATSEGNICLLSNIPAHKYILNLENKFGFICKNVEDYVNKILELYNFWKNNRKEFLEWRKYIQKRAIELFSLEKIVKKFEEKLLN